MKDWEFKRMLQRLHRQVGQFKRHKRELLEKYKTDKSNNITYRINHCNELLEMF